jgi:NAD(P)-dependent dehydrogenase (short-subunit alcohol dehydrogenase family)
LQGIRGKTAIVTGSGSGIGRATALALAREGAQVVVADIVISGAEETVELIEKNGGVGLAVYADVGDEASVKAMVDAAVERFGALHLLHNNAAEMRNVGLDKGVVHMDTEVWDRAMVVNLRGPMLGCKHAIPHMIAAGGGAIVSTSSVAGQYGDLSRVAYGVSKAGIDSLTRYVATIYGKRGIRANAVAPGLVVTQRWAKLPAEELALFTRNVVNPKLGGPDEIAEVVTFLLSDGAAYLNGQVINVDGGMRMHTPLFAHYQP